MIIRAARPDELQWIIDRTGLEPTAGMKAIQAVDERTGRILAQIAGTGWTANSVMIHIAVDEPIALRELLREAAVWVFLQAGRGVALGAISAGNGRSLRLAKRLGFREVHRVREGYARGVDLVVVEMRKEACRWLEMPARKRVAA